MNKGLRFGAILALSGIWASVMGLSMVNSVASAEVVLRGNIWIAVGFGLGLFGWGLEYKVFPEKVVQVEKEVE